MKDKKNTKFICSLVLSAVLGAGVTYLANKEKIDFMNRHPAILETKKFAEENLLIGTPEHNETAEINAFLALYGDKYTSYEPKVDIFSEDYIKKTINTSELAIGSGFRVNFDNSGKLVFSYIQENGNAYKGGIRANDVVKSIDGADILEFKDAKKLLGEDGTTVNLVVERDSKEMKIEFVRVCNSLEANGITTEKYGDTLYMKFDRIGDYILEPAEKALSENKFDSLIIDLRNNPGGSIDIGVRFVDWFIDEAHLEHHSKSGDDMTTSTTDGIIYDIPIVVLANEETISAAEMVTAFLKQYADTTIVGMKTFGKGIYQQTGLFKGGTLTYTDGYVTVGDWECYHGIGIEPDVEIPMDSALIGTENDIQLEKALELVK